MKIEQISTGGPLVATALDAMKQVAPILEDIEFYSQTGTTDTLYEDSDAAEKTKITRSLNENNTATPPTPTPQVVTKKIISFDSKVDKVYEQRQYDLPTARERQLRRDARQVGFRFQYMMFEGDVAGDAEDFDGLRNIAKVEYTNSNGVLVPSGSDNATIHAQQLAVEALVAESRRLRAVKPVVYMNEKMLLRWVTVGKSLGYYKQIDEFGKTIDVVAGLRLKSAGIGSDGANLLPFTESANGGGSSSIFFADWGESERLTALTSVGLSVEDNGKVGNFYVTNVNMDMALGLESPWSLVVSQGWKVE